jgi:hypothetical protein
MFAAHDDAGESDDANQECRWSDQAMKHTIVYCSAVRGASWGLRSGRIGLGVGVGEMGLHPITINLVASSSKELERRDRNRIDWKVYLIAIMQFNF